MRDLLKLDNKLKTCWFILFESQCFQECEQIQYDKSNSAKPLSVPDEYRSC